MDHETTRGRSSPMLPKRFFNFHAGRGEVHIGSRLFRLPERAPVRIGLGAGLLVGGSLGFLPVLGFWMIPLGLLVLSQDLPLVRRWRRSFVVKMERRNGKRPKRNSAPADTAE
ncbi:hypothetical protein WNY80_03675 [Hoeflea sp. AS16]